MIDLTHYCNVCLGMRFKLVKHDCDVIRRYWDSYSIDDVACAAQIHHPTWFMVR